VVQSQRFLCSLNRLGGLTDNGWIKDLFSMKAGSENVPSGRLPHKKEARRQRAVKNMRKKTASSRPILGDQ
jgi:hypothetical protein